jgi:hypothetical protein
MIDSNNTLFQRVLDIESSLVKRRIQVRQKIAVFDLDDTLLDGDIGDAVFARLKLDENDRFLTIQQERLALEWNEYRTLVKSGKKQQAYLRVVTCMAGIPLRILTLTTRNLIRASGGQIKIEGDTVPLPTINPLMSGLLELLKKLKYRIMIISASNHFSVRLVAGELLGLQRSQAFGIRPKLTYLRPKPDSGRIAVLTGTLHEPVPWARGKADLYALHAGRIPPLITGGDSESDMFLLNLTHPQGLTIWAGKGGHQPRNTFTLYPGP